MSAEPSINIWNWALGVIGTLAGISVSEFISYLKRNEYYKQKVFEKELDTLLEANRVLIHFQNLRVSIPSITEKLDSPEYTEGKAQLLKALSDLRLFLPKEDDELINRAFLYLIGNEIEGSKENLLKLQEKIRSSLKTYLVHERKANWKGKWVI